MKSIQSIIGVGLLLFAIVLWGWDLIVINLVDRLKSSPATVDDLQ